MARPRISERELDVMQALWTLGREASVADIHAAMRGDLAYTTVQTMLNRLAAKGHVRRKLEGRAYLYAAAVKEPAAVRAALRKFVDRFFGGSATELAVHLVDEEMSPAERKQIEKLLAGRKKERR